MAWAGLYGPDVEVLTIAVYDTPFPEHGQTHKEAGDIKQYFSLINKNIARIIGSGKAVVSHCKASLSRSVAVNLAYMMENHGMTLKQATVLHKSKWDATWPNDAFVYQLIEFERELVERGIIKTK